ncbi:MAG: hypothetical protein RLZZ488_2409 [Pseudomonadota bacterium]|jgi:hypothetical protein
MRIRRPSVLNSAALVVSIPTLLLACAGGEGRLRVNKTQGRNGPLTFLASDSTEKIIGKNDLIPVLNDGGNIPQKYARLLDAFGKISMGCTATHIGDGLVLTAGHCFEAPARRSSKSCEGVSVNWGYRRDKSAYLVSQCVKVLAAEHNDNRDYAIFQVDKIPSEKVEFELQLRPKLGTALTIFGHPQGRPLEWSQNCILETSSRGGWGIDQFSHQCDTEPGNSGSTVLDDSSLKIIGIHDGGRTPWNYATYLVDTPLGEFLGDDANRPQPDLPPVQTISLPDMKFGPFQNDQVIELARFGSDLGRSISFDMFIDTEEKKDFVVIRYGENQVIEETGFGNRSFDSLVLPVEISFRSSRFIRSTTVNLNKIRVYR